jgi:hypothetical protein
MIPKIKDAIEEYQCPGCVCGSNIMCYEKSEDIACGKHVAGTMIYPGIGTIYLGMPKGFNRPSFYKEMNLNIFETLKDGWGFDIFNVPVWKYLNNENHTIVRGICPRINLLFIHIFLENCIDKIDCLEITDDDLNKMD